MRPSAIPFVIAAVAATVIGCDRHEPAVARRDKDPVLRPAELSTAGLEALVVSFTEKAKKDESLWGSDEDNEIFAANGPVFKKQLIASIGKSESIIIEEHLDAADLMGQDPVGSDKPPHLASQSVKLDDAQKAAFSREAVAMDGRTDSFSSRCFDPHHRLEFVQKDGTRSSMIICFRCKRVIWDAANLDPPVGFFPALEKVVKAAGLEPARDWYALAREQSASEGDKPQD
jgi:hypothetical protein